MMNATLYFNKIKSKILPKMNSSDHQMSATVATLEAFQQMVGRERNRVNRNGGKFTVIVFRLDPTQQQAESIKKLADGISNRIRISDHVGWYDHNCLGVILPETSAGGAEKIVRDLYHNSNGMPKPPFNLYTYPLNGSSKNPGIASKES